MLATFILGGIWHGAGWTFVFWGFLHGLALIIHRFWKAIGMTMPKILAWIVTFNFINIAWIFFRAKDWDSAMKVLSSMFSLDNIVLTEKYEKYLSFLNTFDGVTFAEITQDIGGDGSKILNWIIVIFVIVLMSKNSNEIIGYPNNTNTKIFTKIYAVYFALIFFIALLSISLSAYSEFIYFNF